MPLSLADLMMNLVQPVADVPRNPYEQALGGRMRGGEGGAGGRDIMQTMEKLQSGEGNYVQISKLRSELGPGADAEIMKLANEGRLMLGRYGGPRPDDLSRFLVGEKGELFHAVAIPREGKH